MCLLLSQTTLQQEKESLNKATLVQKASVTTMTAKIETMTSNLERQKKTEKELQVITFLTLKGCALTVKQSNL